MAHVMVHNVLPFLNFGNRIIQQDAVPKRRPIFVGLYCGLYAFNILALSTSFTAQSNSCALRYVFLRRSFHIGFINTVVIELIKPPYRQQNRKYK